MNSNSLPVCLHSDAVPLSHDRPLMIIINLLTYTMKTISFQANNKISVFPPLKNQINHYLQSKQEVHLAAGISMQRASLAPAQMPTSSRPKRNLLRYQRPFRPRRNIQHRFLLPAMFLLGLPCEKMFIMFLYSAFAHLFYQALVCTM